METDLNMGYMGRHLREDPRYFITAPIVPAKVRALLVRHAVVIGGVEFPDLSYHDGRPNFDKLRTRTPGVMIKVCQRGYVDPEFQRNWSEAGRVRLRRGGYAFYDDRMDPVQQADKMIDLISMDLPEMEWVVDWENTYGGPFNKLRHIVQFMKRIEARTPTAKIALYTGYYWFKDHTDPIAEAEEYAYLRLKRLWLAWYTNNLAYVKVPEPWVSLPLADQLTHLQYTDAVNGADWGVDATIDMNKYNGTRAEWDMEYGDAGPAPAPVDQVWHTHPGLEVRRMVRYGAIIWAFIADPKQVRIRVSGRATQFHQVKQTLAITGAVAGTNGGSWVYKTGVVNERWKSFGVTLNNQPTEWQPWVGFGDDHIMFGESNDIPPDDITDVVGYTFRLIRTGQFVTRYSEANFPTPDARTFSGKLSDNRFALCFCQGNDMLKNGLTFEKEGMVLLELGCIDGGNHDGGSSTQGLNLALSPDDLISPSDPEDAYVLNAILMFAADALPDNGGGMGTVYTYSAVAGVDRAVRSGHNAYADNIGTKIPAGARAYGDELFEPQTDQYGIYNGKQVLFNKAGDKWLHVLRIINADGTSKNVDGWTAIIHLGAQQMTLTQGTPPDDEMIIHTIEVLKDGRIKIDGGLPS